MKYEKSCGAVIFKDSSVLLIKSLKGHWSFPKGHMENGETELETANREVLEETNIKILIDEDRKVVINYQPEPGVNKDVVYFKANYLSGNLHKQLEEVEETGWYSIDDALNRITYDQEKDVLKKML